MFKLNSDTMFYDYADGQAILINHQTGLYYGASSLASEVLERLLAGKSLAKIAKAVKALPGCPDDIDAKLDAFVNQLKKKQILLDSETKDGGDEPMDEAVLVDGFALTLEEFNEIQDLILADPIHDVDPTQGWPKLKED